MLSGYGWCRLLTPRPPVLGTDETVLEAADAADERLWAEFRSFMSSQDTRWIKWQLHDYLNNDTGVLTYCLSRNHREPQVFDMLAWIARHGSASHGLLYVHVHDDEDESDRSTRRGEPGDHANAYRVHRLMNGEVTELADPFFGPITPGLRAD